MLARLQQAMVAGGLLGAACLLLWGWRSGHPIRGFALAAVLLGVHAALLALEFALQRHQSRHDRQVAPASPRRLLEAWWGEVLAAPRVFYWRQPFRSHRFADHLPADAWGRRGVLLVHGFVCNRGIWNPWLARLRERGVPLVAVNLEPVFGSIDDYGAPIEQGVAALERCTGMAPIVVAHSMGGLALRAWWAGHEGDQRVHKAVTLGTPHGGTWLARWGFAPNTRQMRLDSRWLRALAAREPAARYARFTCLYSDSDNIVFPPSVATLPGADNRLIGGVAHVQMADRPEAWQALCEHLDAPTVAVSAGGPSEPA